MGSFCLGLLLDDHGAIRPDLLTLELLMMVLLLALRHVREKGLEELLI